MKKPNKPARNRTSKSAPAQAKLKRPRAKGPTKAEASPSSKQERVIALLRSASGSTIASMMEATGWQPHSVRGFLAGVVRKRLKLKLESTRVGDERFYRIVGESDGSKKAKRQAA